jgi:hypothetical protein
MTTENNYSELTIIRYNQAITSIKRLYESNSTNIFKNPETFSENSQIILELLYKNYQLSTLPNFISAILWNISLINDKQYNNEYKNRICDIYREYGKKIKEQIEEEKVGKEFELTEKEKKSFMIWEDILKVHQQMLSNLNKTNYNNFLEYVIVSLYVLHPPARADYANMRVFIDDSFIPTNFQDNYCVLQTNPRFVFNKYKTAKHKGTTIVNMDNDLHNILLDWVDINTSEYLLSSYVQSTKSFKPITEIALCRRITLIFEKYANKPVTINTLRHSFVSYMSRYEMENYEKRRENASKMMHSLNMADKYRRMVYIT